MKIKTLIFFQILDGLGNHDTHPFGDDEVSFDSMDQLRCNHIFFTFLLHSRQFYSLCAFEISTIVHSNQPCS
jgi:hypothetical protein